MLTAEAASDRISDWSDSAPRAPTTVVGSVDEGSVPIAFDSPDAPVATSEAPEVSPARGEPGAVELRVLRTPSMVARDPSVLAPVAGS